MSDLNLTESLKQTALARGVNLFGVADLKNEIFQPIKDNPLLQAYPYALSLAVVFPPASVHELKEGPSHTYVYHYRIVNALLDEVALKLSNQLTVQGFQSFPIPASQRTGKRKLVGIFPHRLPAIAAGLGYRGKNNLVLIKKAGPCVRLISVLTNAPLIANKPHLENRCGKCRACIDNCPAKALSQDENGKSEFDATECDQYQQWVRDRFGKRVCGKCVAFCPQTP